MLNNQMRREILDTARATGFEGSILDLYQMANQGANVPEMLQAEAQAKQQNMLVAQTPQEQQVGLREQHAMGNTDASMVFPDVAPNTAFNTEGIKVPINISKMDEQGHLVQSYQNVPPGIKNLPTGPKRGTVIETPAYQTGGFPVTMSDAIAPYISSEEKEKANIAESTAAIGNAYRMGQGTPIQEMQRTVGKFIKTQQGNIPYYKNVLRTAVDAVKGNERAQRNIKHIIKQTGSNIKDRASETVKQGTKFLKPLARTAASGFTTVLPVDISRDASDMPALYGTGATGDPYASKIDYNKAYQDGGMRGMMKAKIAMENQFGNNPAITRMIKPTTNPYDFGDGRIGTHYMGSYGKFAIPNIQDVDGTLQYTGPRMDEAIKFDRMDDATYFAENYKDVAPALRKKKGGYRSKYGKDPVTGTGKKPKGSGRRLYTDENPKDTVGIKFATPADARATVAKVKKVNKPFARKIQILTVGEQRAKVMGKTQIASIFTRGKEAIRRSRKTT
jgi:uncharacterized membrane protein (UPF0127 family)